MNTLLRTHLHFLVIASNTEQKDIRSNRLCITMGKNSELLMLYSFVVITKQISMLIVLFFFYYNSNSIWCNELYFSIFITESFCNQLLLRKLFQSIFLVEKRFSFFFLVTFVNLIWSDYRHFHFWGMLKLFRPYRKTI